jgi:hypothetical protein
MSIVRDDGDEYQTRVQRMINEFRKAQSRRLAKTAAVIHGGHVAEIQRDVDAQAAGVGASTTPRPSQLP